MQKVKCAEDVTGPSAKDMANELKRRRSRTT